MSSGDRGCAPRRPHCRFDDAVLLSNLTGQPADIAAVRRYQRRAGISLNAKQQLSADVGLFARAGWAPGDVEPYEFSGNPWPNSNSQIQSKKLGELADCCAELFCSERGLERG
jgi:high affinity Mn2+ porin